MADINANKPGYKKTKIGWIPEEWQLRKFENFLADKSSLGYGVLQPGNGIKDGVPMIRTIDLHDHGIKDKSKLLRIPKELDEQYSRTRLKGGEIIISVMGTLGRTIIVPTSWSGWNVNRALAVARLNQDIDKEFLIQTFRSPQFEKRIIEEALGSAQKRINLGDLKSYRIISPPLPEQRQIATILSTWDKAIEKLDQLIKKKRELKKGLMQQLLTGQLRFPEFVPEGGTKYKETKLGKIPEEWEVVRLTDIASFRNGKAHEKNISEVGEFILVNSKFISTEGDIIKRTDINLSPLNQGEITMVMSDIPNGRAIAKCFFIEKNGLYTLNQRICAIKAEHVDSRYLYYALNRNSYYLRFDNGVSQTNLRKDQVLSCPLRIPSFSEQFYIAEVLSNSEKEIEKLEQEKDKLQLQKKGLIQQLLTGAVRVKPLANTLNPLNEKKNC